MRLRDMKINHRLILGFAIPVALSVILFAISIVNMFSLRSRYEGLLANEVMLEQQILNCRIQMNTAARYARDIVLDTEKANYSTNQQSLNSALDQLTTAQTYVSDNYMLEDGKEKSYLAAVEAWESVISEIISAVDANDFEKAKTIMVNECTPALNELRDAAVELTNTIDAYITEVESEQQQAIVFMMILMIGLLVLFLILIVIFAIDPFYPDPAERNASGVGGNERWRYEPGYYI